MTSIFDAVGATVAKVDIYNADYSMYVDTALRHRRAPEIRRALPWRAVLPHGFGTLYAETFAQIVADVDAYLRQGRPAPHIDDGA